MTAFGTAPAFILLGGLAAFRIVAALRFWPADESDNVGVSRTQF